MLSYWSCTELYELNVLTENTANNQPCGDPANESWPLASQNEVGVRINI